MILEGDQLIITDFHHLSHSPPSKVCDPHSVKQLELKGVPPVHCLESSNEVISASDVSTFQPHIFWVGTYTPAKVIKVCLASKAKLAEVEVWSQGYVRQLDVLGPFLLCELHEPKTTYASCLCYALPDIPKLGNSSPVPPNAPPLVPFRQFVQFSGICSEIRSINDRHVFYYDYAEFNHLSVKHLEALPKQTSLTIHPDIEQ